MVVIVVITIIHVVAITAITTILVIAIIFQKDSLKEEMIDHVKKRWKEDKQDQISLILIIVRKLVDVKSNLLNKQTTPIDCYIYGSILLCA